jgi:hypothetical protein
MYKSATQQTPNRNTFAWLIKEKPITNSKFQLQPLPLPPENLFNHKNFRVMNNYELMVIFTPVLSEESLKPLRKSTPTIITEHGGAITHSNPWGSEITGVSCTEKNYRYLLGFGIQRAIQLQ